MGHGMSKVYPKLKPLFQCPYTERFGRCKFYEAVRKGSIPGYSRQDLRCKYRKYVNLYGTGAFPDTISVCSSEEVAEHFMSKLC